MAFNEQLVLNTFNRAVERQSGGSGGGGGGSRRAKRSDVPAPAQGQWEAVVEPQPKRERGADRGEEQAAVRQLPMLDQLVPTSCPPEVAAVDALKHLLSSYYAAGYWMARYEALMASQSQSRSRSQSTGDDGDGSGGDDDEGVDDEDNE